MHGLNASGFSPAAWTPEFFRRKYGDDMINTRPLRGWDTVTIPGAVAGWVMLHRKFGKLPFADLMAPAIEYAERGFAVSPITQAKWQAAEPLLKDYPGFAQHFLPKGRVPAVGEHFVLAGAARTLNRIAQTNGEDYYRGEIAAAICRYARETGGALVEADFSAFWDFIQTNAWVGTVSKRLTGTRGEDFVVHQIPPNGQGIAAAICFGILNHTDLALRVERDGIDAPGTQHLLIEAMKLAFADAYEHVADARSMRVTPAQMLDDGYLKSRAALIDPKRAQPFAPGAPPRGGTIYLAASDASGMMISLHPVQLFGLRFRCRGARLWHLAAEPRPRFLARFEARQLRETAPSAVPHDHPGILHARRRAADGIRRDGRQHAAPRTRADARADALRRPAAAGCLRRAALEMGLGCEGRSRADRGAGAA